MEKSEKEQILKIADDLAKFCFNGSAEINEFGDPDHLTLVINHPADVHSSVSIFNGYSRDVSIRLIRATIVRIVVFIQEKYYPIS